MQSRDCFEKRTVIKKNKKDVKLNGLHKQKNIVKNQRNQTDTNMFFWLFLFV